MKTRIFFKELKRFFIESKKIILICMLASILIFAGISAVSVFRDSSDDKDNLSIENTEEMAEFTFYIEKSDQTQFNNNPLLEDIIFTNENLKIAENETGVEITDVLLKQEEVEFIPTPEDRGVLGIYRDLSNETMVFQVKVGNKAEQLAIANHFFEKIVNNEIPFLEDKTIYIVERPETTEILNDSSALTESTDKTVSPLLLVIMSIAALLLGFILGVIISVLYHIFERKINFAFNYNIEEEDILLIERNDIENVKYDIMNPKVGTKVIVSDFIWKDETTKQLTDDSTEIIITSNLIEINPQLPISEIVFLVVEKQTTKEWYYSQREYLKNFKSSVKVIQIPKKILG